MKPQEATPVRLPLAQRTWATVRETSSHFRCSEWFVRKTANEMAALKVPGHPIKTGHEWLIDIDAMKSYFSLKAEEAAARSRYPMSQVDGNLATVRDDEDWGWR